MANKDYWAGIRRLVGTDLLFMPCAAGAVVKEGRILLVWSKSLHQWQIPGGMQEPGESVAETARREIREETGLDLEVGDLIGVYTGPEWIFSYPHGDQVQQILFFFQMQGEIGEIDIQMGELAKYGFFAPDEVPEDTMPCCKQKIADWAAYQGKPAIR